MKTLTKKLSTISNKKPVTNTTPSTNIEKQITLQDIPFHKYLQARPSSDKIITSIKMAQLLNRQHDQLLKSIRQQIDYMVSYNDECIRTGREGDKINIHDYFIPSEYIDANNQKRPSYNITVIGYEYLILRQCNKNNFIFLMQYIKFFDTIFNQNKQFSNVINLQNDKYSNKILFEKLDDLAEKIDQMNMQK